MRRRSPKIISLAALTAVVVGCSATPRGSSQPRGFGAGFAVGRAQDFSASLYLTDDGERFLAAVRRPGDPANLNVTDHASRGQQVAVFFAVAGCAANTAGFCDVRVDFEVRDADGRVVAHNRDVPAVA